MMTDKSQPSCGQSRFGCWVCTVVKEDKSMKALINNGNEWMAPLLDYRDEMVNGRNISEHRLETRRNGQTAVDAEGHNQGNYTFEYRCKMLKKLLELQRLLQRTKPHMELITNQELVAIQINWYRDGYFAPKVTDILMKCTIVQCHLKICSTKNDYCLKMCARIIQKIII